MSSTPSQKLYGDFISKLAKIIAEGEDVVVGEEVIHKEASPAYFSVARQFLKDIGENGALAKPSMASKLKELSLPFAADGAYPASPRAH